MEFNYLGLVNRLLLMAKRAPVTAISSTVNSDAYRAQLCINDTIQDMAHLLRIRSRMTTFTFNTVAGQRTYNLPKQITYPLYTMREKTNDLTIKPANTREFDYLVADDTSSGTPETYYLEEFSPVSNQPASTGEAVYVVSSSASDTGIVVLQGYSWNSNNFATEEISLNGTSAAGSANTYVKISSLSKGTTTGTITVRNYADTTDFQELSPTEGYVSIPVIGLHPIPSSVMTIYCRGWYKIPALQHENSIPVGLNEQHLNAIVRGGMARFMEYDPKIPNEAIGSFYERYYDEIQKINTYDQKDGVTYRMRSPYWTNSGGTPFNPLDRGSR